MLENQKCSSWSVCEITLQSQEFNCRQGCFPEGSVDGGRRRKRNGRSGLFLPFSSKHDWVRTFPCCPLWGTVLSSTQAAVPWLLQLLSLGDTTEPLFNPQGMTAPTWIMIPGGDTLCHHWRFMDWEKETSPKLSCHWTLNTQFGGAQTWGTVAEVQLQHKFCGMCGI